VIVHIAKNTNIHCINSFNCYLLFISYYISNTPAKKYNSRTNKGDVVASHGNIKAASWNGSAQNVTVENYAPEQEITRNFKYMFQKMADKRDGKTHKDFIIQYAMLICKKIVIK